MTTEAAPGRPPGLIGQAVTTWSLEMTDPGRLRPAREPDAAQGAAIVRAQVPSPELSRYLYTAVGGDWYWTDRLTWSYRQWLAWLDRDEVATWVLTVQGTPAGYVELEAQGDDDVEIAYFGLLPGFLGRGLGGYLLTQGVRHAWRCGRTWATSSGPARRVWVHTCTLDGPRALSNYQARGFTVFEERTEHQDLPPAPPGPWPGAGPR